MYKANLDITKMAKQVEVEKSLELNEEMQNKVKTEQHTNERDAEKSIKQAEQERIQRQADREKIEREEAAEQRRLKFELQIETIRQEHELRMAKMRQEHELEMEKLKQEHLKKESNNVSFTAQMPTLPVFDDKHDDIDAYIDRFERFATVHKWTKTDWAIILSSLLSGKSLEAYTRLSDSEALDYDKVKAALRKRYNLTEEGYRLKFRKCEPEESENPTELFTRITKYLEQWIELAKATDYEKLKTLLIKEQFLNICNKQLAMYLNEQPFKGMKEMCDRAERYLQAHSQKLTTDNERKSEGIKRPASDINTEQRQSNTRQQQPKDCYNCGKLGHISSQCRNEGGGNEQQCKRCKRFGRLAETCRSSGEFAGTMRTKGWIRTKGYHTREQ